jgi:hypothetical protein
MSGQINPSGSATVDFDEPRVLRNVLPADFADLVVLAPGPAPGPQEGDRRAREAPDMGREVRVDPYDGQEYTLEEMRRLYAREYPSAQIEAYWFENCTLSLGDRA